MRGNNADHTYVSDFRLASVTDAIGQVTTLSYGSTNSTNAAYYRIVQVTDPFGRYATFDYNTNGLLSKITDVIGLESEFTYASGSDFISALTTPYVSHRRNSCHTH